MAQRQFRSDDSVVWGERYGSGVDGALTISGNTTFSAANAGCSGTSGDTALTLDAASSFANNDLVVIHQSRGTGVGNWELNKISSGGGTTSLTMAYSLINTYTDSGSSQAQIVKLFQYSSVTVNGSVTWTAPAWDENKGGILAFLCTGTTTVTGTISASSKGHIKSSGTSRAASPSNANTGEGTVGASTTGTSANGNAGGGTGGFLDGGPGGGGGSYGTSGTAGGAGQGTGGSAGNTVGAASLTTMMFGGSGAGGKGEANAGSGAGGGDGTNGGGIVLIISPIITATGSIVSGTTNGGNGYVSGTEGSGGGGSGAGGSLLFKGQNITLGSSIVTATGGTGGTSGGVDSGAGGNGGSGRIHVDY